MMILIYIIPTINRVTSIFVTNNDYNDVMTLIHTIMSPLIGFFNVIVYFLNPMAGKNMVKNCKMCCLMCFTMDRYTEYKWRVGEKNSEKKEEII